jgi:hypothetical protein
VAAWTDAADVIAGGRERIGPFRRFDGRDRVFMLSESERDGCRLVLFHHTIDRESDENTTTTIASFASPALDLTSFCLEPVGTPPSAVETIGIKVLEALFFWTRFVGRRTADYAPVVFGDRADFTRLYRVTSPSDGARVREVLHGRLLDHLCRYPGWSLEAITGQILLFRNEVMVTGPAVDAFVDEAAAVAALFRAGRR